MLDINSTLLLFQTIPGIPSTLVSGSNAKPIIDVSNNIWGACTFLFTLFVVVGIWMSQFQWIAKKTGGPAQYLNRAITVGLTLAGYKVIFAIIMWTCAFAAYKIYPSATADAWIPVGGSLTKYVSSSTPTPTPTPGSPSASPTPPSRQIGKNTSVVEVIMWGLSNAYGMTFQALPAMLVIMLCNIFFVLAVFIISAFWLVFALILYALGPFMITAGLIPEYGDKIWGHWIGATIQCGLWQVWMAFCGMLITSPMLTQLSHLNPSTRLSATSGGGDLSGALMDVQQAAYSVTFLVLYLSTPFVVNYIFPMGTSGSMGAFMMGAATKAAGKGIRMASAVKSGGMSEVAKQTASSGIKQTTSRAESAMNAGAGSTSTGVKSAQAGNKASSGASSGSTSQNSYDGAERQKQYRVAPAENTYSGGSNTSSESNGGGKGGYTSNSSQGDGDNSSSSNSASRPAAQSSQPPPTKDNSYQPGNTARPSDTGSSANSSSGSDQPQTTSAPEKPVYKESSSRPSDIRFGKLPEPNKNVPKPGSTAQNDAGDNS